MVSDTKVFAGVIILVTVLIFLAAASSFSGKSTEVSSSSSAATPKKHYSLGKEYSVDEPNEDPLSIFRGEENEESNNNQKQPASKSGDATKTGTSPSDASPKKKSSSSTSGNSKKKTSNKDASPSSGGAATFPPPVTNNPDDDENHIPFVNSEDEQKYAFANWLDDKASWQPTSAEARSRNKPMALALREFNHVDWYTIKKGDLEVMCILAIMATDNCDPWKDTLVQCVLKVGKRNFDKILSNRCVGSHFWHSTINSLLDDKTAYEGVDEGPDAYKKLNRGYLWDSQIKKNSDNWKEKSWPYVPPHKRHIAPFPGGRNCSAYCQHLPIGFGLPKVVFKKRVPRTKSFDWNPLMPKYTPASGHYEVRIQEEDIFYELYSQSFFAWTHRRAGWDAMRHYDIIASGGLPFFFDIEYSPTRSLGHLPKALLKEVHHLYGVDHIKRNPNRYVVPSMFGGVNFKIHGEIRRTGDPLDPMFNMTRYYELAQEILDYARKYMTGEAVVAYALKELKAEDAKSIIIFSRGSQDYLELTLSCAQYLGIDVTIVTDAEHAFYKMRFTDDGKMTREERDEWLAPHHGRAYGAAFGFASRFGPRIVFRKTKDARVIQNIKEGTYDVAFFALSGTNYNYVAKFKDWSPKTKLAFLNFHDSGAGDPDQNTRNGCDLLGNREGIVFIREMTDTNRC